MISRLVFIFLIIFFYKNILNAEEFYVFETQSLEIVENGELIEAKNGKATNSNKNIEIIADYYRYSKLSKKLIIEGNAIISIKSEKLRIQFDKGIINQNTFLFESQNETTLEDLNNNVKIISKKIIFDKKNNILSSDYKSNITDIYGNLSIVDNFKYDINKELLKVNNLNFYDKHKNNLRLSIAYINVQTNNLYGKDVIVNLNDQNLKINENNQPRLKGNSILNNENVTEVKKGIFTTCKKNDDCPPWEISAENVKHDKKNKTIKYENAILKIYDKPVIYLPVFSHPDPTVDRQSGFLTPSFNNSSNKKSFLSIPYFYVISDNKDATFNPRFYDNEQFLIQTELRQANKNSNHTTDFSFKIDDDKKLKSHLFYDYNKQFIMDNYYNNFNLKIQKTSKDTYIQKNEIKSNLINDETILENSTKLNFINEDILIGIEATVYEDLSKDDSDKYEYLLPKIDLRKKINNYDINGNLFFDSKFIGKQYNTNILEKININNLIYESVPKISKKGFYNDYKILIKNSNTDAKNSGSLKNNENYYLSGLFQLNSSLPLKKESKKYKSLLNPRISVKIAPPYTRDDRKNYTKLDINNIYSINRIQKDDSIEGGASITYGNKFSIDNKESNLEVFNFKIANNLRFNENKDLTSGSQLGKKMSSFLNEISFKPNKNFNFLYNSSIKNNLSEINYENFITEFNLLEKIILNFDYLNQNEASGDIGSYWTNKTDFLLDDKNKLSFSTRRNKNINLTEYYNLAYQYEVDCLTASITYKKEFYQDRDIKPNNSLFFRFSIIPDKNSYN